MSGRGNRGGRSTSNGPARGRGRGNRSGGRSSTVTDLKKKGLCAALGHHVFDHGDKSSANQVKTSWEKLTNHVGTLYGTDIATELATGTKLHIVQPEHSALVQLKHQEEEDRRKARQTRLKDALQYEANKLKAKADALLEAGEDDSEVRYKFVQKTNEIEVLQYEIDDDLPIALKGEAKTQWETEWKMYKSRMENLIKHRGQALNMIKGQCTLTLMEQMKCDSDYTACMVSNDPLRLRALIERTIITQSDNRYVFATLYEQEVGLFGFQQNKMTEDQWHERFKTKVFIGDTLGVSRDHTMALNYVAKERYKSDFEDIADEDDKELVRADAKEWYLAYIFLRQSGSQHDKLKTDLADAFTMALTMKQDLRSIPRQGMKCMVSCNATTRLKRLQLPPKGVRSLKADEVVAQEKLAVTVANLIKNIGPIKSVTNVASSVTRHPHVRRKIPEMTSRLALENPSHLNRAAAVLRKR